MVIIILILVYHLILQFNQEYNHKVRVEDTSHCILIIWHLDKVIIVLLEDE